VPGQPQPQPQPQPAADSGLRPVTSSAQPVTTSAPQPLSRLNPAGDARGPR